MRITLGELRQIVSETVLTEFGPIRGGLRSSHSSAGKKPRYNMGKVEDENRELSFSEVESTFPGAVDAWTEIVPVEFPDFPFADDPYVVRRRSVFFKEGDKLTVAAQHMPQITLATWDPAREDWFLTGDAD